MRWKSALKNRVTKCLAVSILIYIPSMVFMLATVIGAIVIPLWIADVGFSVFLTSGVVSILCLVVSDRRKSKLKLQRKGGNEK